jgi:hypothetical protein
MVIGEEHVAGEEDLLVPEIYQRVPAGVGMAAKRPGTSSWISSYMPSMI